MTEVLWESYPLPSRWRFDDKGGGGNYEFFMTAGRGS